MKKNLLYNLLLIMSFSMVVSSCSSDDDGGSPNNNNQQIADVENTAESGTWIISSYIDSGQDETNDFNGFNFTFSPDGTLTANSSTETKIGTWSVTDSNSNDDSSDDIDFNINFPVPDTDDFEDLNDDWDIVSYSNTMLSLISISGGNGGTDTLIFQKN